MTLLPPEVLGPLSVWSTGVHLRGQLIGAKVSVRCGTQTVVSPVAATWFDEVFPLDAGAHLVAGEQVSATQDAGPAQGGPSAPSQLPVPVQAAPAQLGRVQFTSGVYECGGAIELSGAVPGATVRVGVMAGGTFHQRGHTVSADGYAGVFFSKGTGASETLVAHQTHGQLKGPDTAARPTIATTKAVPPLHLPGPLLPCQRAITIAGIIPGAAVTVQRSINNSSVTGFFVESEAEFDVDPSLAAGETLTVSQGLIQPCGWTSPPTTAKVGPVGTPPTPEIAPMYACGSSTIRVSNLVPGAVLRLQWNGLYAPPVLGDLAVYAPTMHVALPPGLFNGPQVTAVQGLCDKWSAPSNGIRIYWSVDAGTLAVHSPLFACGGAVHVTGCQPGSVLEVWSAAHGLIGRSYLDVDGNQLIAATVPVAPLLTQGDSIHAQMSGCDAVHTSAPVRVDAAPERIGVPTIADVLVGQTSVTVQNVVPGAFVEVFVDGVARASGWGGATELTLSVIGPSGLPPVYPPLADHQRVKARQSLCGHASGFGPEAVVHLRAPHASFTATPDHGPVPLTVHFTDTSTGDQIVQWQWNFGNTGSPLQAPPDPTFTTMGNQPVSLWIKNADGATSTATATISVYQQNTPPPPADNTPYITLNQHVDTTQIPPQEIVDVHGIRFTPNEPIEIVGTDSAGGTPGGTGQSDGTGAFTVSIPLYKDDSDPSVITASFKAHVVGSNTWSNEPSIQY